MNSPKHIHSTLMDQTMLYLWRIIRLSGEREVRHETKEMRKPL